MKYPFTFYIAMIFISLTIVSVYCKDKKQKEVHDITIDNRLYKWDVTDSIRRMWTETGIDDTIRFFDFIICDSLGEYVATKDKGKWTITNCEKALEVMLKSQKELGERYDNLLKKLYKDEEKETPLDAVFANNKN